MENQNERPNNLSKSWLLSLGILIGLGAAGLILLLASPRRGNPVELLPPPTSSPILVHVSGAINNPGIYQLAIGSRVQNAIEAAGGSLEEADTDRINLARVLVDGQQVHLPFLGQAAKELSFPININIASADQLAVLPGIGPVTAEAIVLFRDTHGPFQRINDIQKVSGIGPNTFSNLSTLIAIDG